MPGNIYTRPGGTNRYDGEAQHLVGVVGERPLRPYTPIWIRPRHDTLSPEAEPTRRRPRVLQRHLRFELDETVDGLYTNRDSLLDA